MYSVVKIKLVILAIMLAAAGFAATVATREDRGDVLKIVFLNIGQGDAIYIEAPNGNQMIVDGGPPGRLMPELGAVMPFYDRSIDMLVVTNPDLDHFAGFIDALGKLDIGAVLEPGTVGASPAYRELESKISSKGVKRLIARRGMDIMLDSRRGVVLHVLFPDRDVSKLATNDGSIVMRLEYGSTSVMFMGDAPQKIEKYVLSLGSDVSSDILKLGHHGSRTSTSLEFVKAVAPKLAVISAGRDNKYGHPHKETIDTLRALAVPYEITFEKGRINAASDGRHFSISPDYHSHFVPH